MKTEMSNEIRVGMVTSSMSRRAGGLFESVRKLSQNLVSDGCDVQVFAGEDEFSSIDREPWGKLPVKVFPIWGPKPFGFQWGLTRALREAELSLVHSHGLWMYPSMAALRWSAGRRPVVISPRGMLDPWAISNSRWKKRIASVLYEDAHLRGAACLHALSEGELRAFRLQGLENPVALIPNGVDLAKTNDNLRLPQWSERLPGGCRKLLFLGRIHPKKGLGVLLQAFSMVSRRGNDGEWRLVVAGWDQGGHEAELVRQAESLGIHQFVHFVGPQFGDDKVATLATADAFILPSLSEGLPVAVLEAWAYGIPVLMTDECNLPDGFTSQSAIRIVPSAKDIAGALEALMSMPSEELKAIGRNGQNLVAEKYNWSMVSNKMHRLYEWIVSGGSPPEFVSMD